MKESSVQRSKRIITVRLFGIPIVRIETVLWNVYPSLLNDGDNQMDQKFT